MRLGMPVKRLCVRLSQVIFILALLIPGAATSITIEFVGSKVGETEAIAIAVSLLIVYVILRWLGTSRHERSDSTHGRLSWLWPFTLPEGFYPFDASKGQEEVDRVGRRAARSNPRRRRRKLEERSIENPGLRPPSDHRRDGPA